jgi:multisubunit Na+/H+ antiporter MnhE subunit
MPRTTKEIIQYSAIRIELIKIRRNWFFWSIPIALAAGFVYRLLAEPLRNTALAPVASLFGLFALFWPSYCLYKFSMAIEPKRSVAWSLVGLGFIPVLGWIFIVSNIFVANRIIRQGPTTAPGTQSATVRPNELG